MYLVSGRIQLASGILIGIIIGLVIYPTLFFDILYDDDILYDEEVSGAGWEGT